MKGQENVQGYEKTAACEVYQNVFIQILSRNDQTSWLFVFLINIIECLLMVVCVKVKGYGNCE